MIEREGQLFILLFVFAQNLASMLGFLFLERWAWAMHVVASQGGNQPAKVDRGAKFPDYELGTYLASLLSSNAAV